MSTYLNIFLRPDFKQTETEVWANIHILRGYTSETVATYRKLAEEMKTLLPGLEITEEEVRCSKVVESTYCKNFTMIAWNGMIPKQNEFEKLGWCITDRKPDYYTT
jgi:hypothetical protein